jgi:hypothetical protein
MLHSFFVEVLARDHQQRLIGQAETARLVRQVRRSRRNRRAKTYPLRSAAAPSPPVEQTVETAATSDLGRPVAA